MCRPRQNDLLGVRQQLGELVRGGGRRRTIVSADQHQHRLREGGELRAKVDQTVLASGGEVAQDLGPVDDLVAGSGLTADAVAAALVELELTGEAVCADGVYRLMR